MTLPAKRKRPQMGLRDQIQRIFPAHRRFVKKHGCCIPRCPGGPIQFAHAKTRGSGGYDAQGVSLCELHHAEQHAAGIETFQARYRVNLFVMAAEFAAKTTDKALREYLKEHPQLHVGRLVSTHMETAQ